MDAHPQQNTPVCSYNGWDPLEEVIVGTPFHIDYETDVTFDLFFLRNLRREPQVRTETHTARDRKESRAGKAQVRRVPTDKMREELAEDTAEFIDLLVEAGVTVRRPESLRTPVRIVTPDWESAMAHALMSRDLFLVIGDEIIETAPMLRSRYLESHLYKELFTEYFRGGARWTMAPRSRLQDRNFDYSYALQHGYDEPLPEDPFMEIMFDGPQVLRLGRDLVFNCSTANHRMGRAWLQRHLGPIYHVHEIAITDHHIDGLLMPLRPGVLLINELVDVRQLPASLRTWKMITYTPAADMIDDSDDGPPLLASESIGMNLLSLDTERVVVQDYQTTLMRQLEENGFTSVPCRWRHGRRVGGGFHCMTLDVRRRGTLEDYFDTGPPPSSAFTY